MTTLFSNKKDIFQILQAVPYLAGRLFFLNMKRVLFLLLSLSSVLLSNAQDSTATKKNEVSADGFGLSAGLVFGHLKMDEVAQFLPGTERVLKATPKSTLGMSAALFYEFGKPEVSYRIATEVNFLQTYIEYDSGEQNLEEGYVYPVTIEVPIMAMYHLQKSYPISFGIGPRAIFPIPLFNSTHPTTKDFGFNLDFAISKKIALKNTAMRMELAYSLGLSNLLMAEDNDPYTNNIDGVKRDVFAFRLYFN